MKGPSPGAKLNVKLTTVLSETSEKPSDGSRKFQSSSNGKTMLSSGGGQKIIKIKKSANFNMSGSGHQGDLLKNIQVHKLPVTKKPSF